jgi:Cu(I)/Ag(I) efflux system membrane protein CusA/SilA
MIEKIIELSIKNKFLVILGILFIILGGAYALVRTPLDAIPDLSDVQVIIFTEYAGGTFCQSGAGLLFFWLLFCIYHL